MTRIPGTTFSDTPLPKHTASSLAAFFHETYERLAPSFSYKTREASAVPWEDVPENNKNLMIAVCEEVLKELKERGV
jgi:hypothetical protein